MELFYDNIVYSLQKIGGISSYWYELTKRVQADERINVNFIETGSESQNILRRMLDLAESDVSVRKTGNMYIERFRRVDVAPLEHTGIFHSSYFRVPRQDSKLKVVCTVHDFTHDMYFNGPRAWLHNLAKKRAIMESDAIITVSENTRNDLIRYYPTIDESKVHVIYNGVADEFTCLETETESDTRTFLFVGARDDYKNFIFAVQIVSGLKNARLSIVGRPFNKKETRFLEVNIPGRYTLYSNISTQDLNILYNSSFCLLYPSSYEGFGIPLLEAMRAGCPFIALNTSSIPEVAGHAGVLLSNLDLEEAWQAIALIDKDRQQFVEIGMQQSHQFSWDKCYSQTLNLYNSLL
jgi:mannosyltransferase